MTLYLFGAKLGPYPTYSYIIRLKLLIGKETKSNYKMYIKITQEVLTYW